MTLKKFLNYYDDMSYLMIFDFNLDSYDQLLFEGHVFDKGAKKKLKKLFKQKYKLEINDDGCAVMLFPYQNENGANLCKTQINVYKNNY